MKVSLIDLRGTLIRCDCRDEDFAKFKEQEQDIGVMRSQYKQMEMRLESMEQAQVKSEELAR